MSRTYLYSFTVVRGLSKFRNFPGKQDTEQLLTVINKELIVTNLKRTN